MPIQDFASLMDIGSFGDRTDTGLTKESAIHLRRSRVEAALNLDDEILVIYSGKPIGVPGQLDVRFPCPAHPDFRWLTEDGGLDHALVYDPKSGWTEYFRENTIDDEIWSGLKPHGRGVPIEELEGWLKSQGNRPIVTLGEPPKSFSPEIAARLSERKDIEDVVWHLRRVKDPYAISKIEVAIAATQEGLAAMSEIIKPGITELSIKIELEYRYMKAGADALAFPTIVGVGTNSAVLHSEPTDRVVKSDDWVLVDSGASCDGYVADVTRMFPGGEEFVGLRKDLYEMLLGAQISAISKCIPGNEWIDVHTQTALDLARGLKDIGVITSSPEEAVESGAMGLFLPHGLGHMYGLHIRDASGTFPGRQPGRAAGANVRCNFVLQKGFSMTVEPGIYFVPRLLTENIDKFSSSVDFEKAFEIAGEIGGARIEDDVIVDNIPRVLTADIPK